MMLLIRSVLRALLRQAYGRSLRWRRRRPVRARLTRRCAGAARNGVNGDSPDAPGLRVGLQSVTAQFYSDTDETTSLQRAYLGNPRREVDIGGVSRYRECQCGVVEQDRDLMRGRCRIARGMPTQFLHHERFAMRRPHIGLYRADAWIESGGGPATERGSDAQSTSLHCVSRSKGPARRKAKMQSSIAFARQLPWKMSVIVKGGRRRGDHPCRSRRWHRPPSTTKSAGGENEAEHEPPAPCGAGDNVAARATSERYAISRVARSRHRFPHPCRR